MNSIKNMNHNANEGQMRGMEKPWTARKPHKPWTTQKPQTMQKTTGNAATTDNAEATDNTITIDTVQGGADVAALAGKSQQDQPHAGKKCRCTPK